MPEHTKDEGGPTSGRNEGGPSAGDEMTARDEDADGGLSEEAQAGRSGDATDPGEGGEEGLVEDDADQARQRATGSMTGWQRLEQTFFKPPPPRTPKGQSPAPINFSKMTSAEIRARINQIDDTERKIGLAGAILATIFALIFTIPYMVSKIAVATTVKPLHKTCAGHLTYEANGKGPATCNGVYPASHYVFPLVVWLVFALAIFVTVRIGRRAPVAFALVLTGLAFGTFIVIVPFVAAGGWLLVRAWRTQRYGSPTARAPLEGYVRPGPREPRRSVGSSRSPTGRSSTERSSAGGTTSGRASSGGGLFRRRQSDRAEPESSRSAPAPNKRYTPKTPPRKKAPPPE